METRGGSARPGQFTSDKSSRKTGTGYGNRPVENLFEQMDAGFVRRQVGSASDAPHAGLTDAAVARGYPKAHRQQRCVSPAVPLDGEPGRILGLDLGSTRVARRDTGRGGRTLMARHGRENRIDWSRPQNRSAATV